MAEREEIASEILANTATYVTRRLSIKNREFHRLLAEAFMEKRIDVLEGLLEPVHLEALSKILLPLLRRLERPVLLNGLDNKYRSREAGGAQARSATNASSEVQNEDAIGKSGLADGDVGLSTDATITNLNLGANFTYESLPEALIPKEKTKKKSAGLKSFIYKLEHGSPNKIDERVEDKIGEIREALAKHSVVLVQGNTGCGKTTKIPRLLLSDYSRVVCTQPRRLAAISVARKVAADMKCMLGDTVGYTIRFDDRSSKNTRLKFVTDGLLLKELASLRCKESRSRGFPEKCSSSAQCIRDARIDASRSGTGSISPAKGQCPLNNEPRKNNTAPFYDLIIIDEAHERSANIDFLMGYCKELAGIKLLVMSATLDSEKFLNYFNCPLIEIKHRPHPIDYFYLKTPTRDPFRTSIETVLSVLKKYDSGDILVFLTGQEDIDQGHALLAPKVDSEKVDVLKLYSAMSAEEQDRIFLRGKRKVILSTNIAETSITIDTVRFVVDSGKVKRMRRNAGSAVDILETVTIAKDQARQRAGRAGRTGPGIVYRIYTLKEFEGMEECQVPEILRADISGVILSLKALGINDVVNFDFIDRPLIDSIRHSVCFLYYLGAVDREGLITGLGRRLAAMPLQPELSMALLTARRLGCLDAVSTIAAFLNASSSIYNPAADSGALRAAKRQFAHPKGEFYTFLLIYDAWHKQRFSFAFLNKHHLNTKSMPQILSIKLQLMNCSVGRPFGTLQKVAYSQKCTNIACIGDNVIEKSFCSGYFMNVARYVGSSYMTVFNNVECYIHPGDGLFKKSPKLVLFYEIVCIRKEYMRNCLEIEADILYETCNSTRDV